MTLCLPWVLGLSFLPSIKRLTPIMALGTILLAACIGLIGMIMKKEWDDRPDELPTLNIPQMPLAACAILYSYEGICLILPVESSMKEPKHFKKVFIGTMSTVATILASFAAINVIVFGYVTNGSLTAFLLEVYHGNDVTWYVMAANTAVSFSVLFSYPLQLFPALEIIGQTKFARWIGCMGSGIMEDDSDDDNDLTGFDPLPPLPEHDVADLDSLPSEHHYGIEEEAEENDAVEEDGDEVKSLISQHSTIRSVTDAIFPKMIMPGDSPQLRAFLVLMTYIIAVVVPNVQVLISLVGALAGSSTALLIPPMLELAWIHTLEEHHQTKKETATAASSISAKVLADAGLGGDKDQTDNTTGHPPPQSFTSTRVTTKPFAWCGGKYWASKIKCYLLFVLGVIFAGIGTYASLIDIIRIYAGKE